MKLDKRTEGKQTYHYQPTVDSLRKLQKLLEKKLSREVSLQETAQAYHTLMDFAFALVDMAPKDSVTFLDKPLANTHGSGV